MVIKPHPRVVSAQAAQMVPRYAPKRETISPPAADIAAMPKENGIDLKGVSGERVIAGTQSDRPTRYQLWLQTIQGPGNKEGGNRNLVE